MQYRVRPRDTLSKLAQAATGDALRYPELMEANHLTSESLEVGDQLVIPSDWDREALGLAPLPAEGASETPVLDQANAEAQRAQDEEGSWADPGAWLSSGVSMASDALASGQNRVEELASSLGQAASDVQAAGVAAEEEVTGRLNALFNMAYERWNGTESTPTNDEQAEQAQAQEVAAVDEAAQELSRVDPDGFDWAAAQAHIDAQMRENGGGYLSIDVEGHDIQTPYQNTSTRKPYRDPVFGGLDEASMLTQYPDLYYAVMGKASPDQVQGALETAVAAGVVHTHVGKSPDAGLTQEDIQAWANDNSIGVDCIGLVMNMLVTSETFAEFDAGKDSDYARMMDVNVTRFIPASTELPDPRMWRPLDVLAFTGHVIMLRDVTDLGDGIWHLNCVESAATPGPTYSDYYWNETPDRNGRHVAGSQADAKDGLMLGYVLADATVRRAGQHDVEALQSQLGLA